MKNFYENNELLKVLFMPISDKLSIYIGASMVEVKEKEGFLFVIFLTPSGKIELKCAAKRMAVTYGGGASGPGDPGDSRFGFHFS